jgi:hypothetical protein
MTITNNQRNVPQSDNKPHAAEPSLPSDALSEPLELWYQQSKQQHPMPAANKQALQQLLQVKANPGGSITVVLQRLIKVCSWHKLQALTAVFALGLGWFLIQQQQQLTYQISQTDTLYPVQLHQLNNENPQPEQSADTKRQQIYSQRYQDYQKSVAAGNVIKQQVLARQSATSGWQLDLCQKMQLQLSDGWLAQFKQQQQWSQPQWAQLASSRYLEVSTGSNGEILAMKATERPPSCAP